MLGVKVWTDTDLLEHLTECPEPLDVTDLSERQPRLLCNCGEAFRHTPAAIAHAELDHDCPKVSL